jgi:hypothetical protein
MAIIQLCTGETWVQFQGRCCVILVDMIHPKMDAVHPCKTVFKSLPNYTLSPLRRRQLFLLWDPCQFSSHEYIHGLQQAQFWCHYCCWFLWLFENYSCLLLHMWLVGWLGYSNIINKIQEMASDSCHMKELYIHFCWTANCFSTCCIKVNFEHKILSDLRFSRQLWKLLPSKMWWCIVW